MSTVKYVDSYKNKNKSYSPESCGCIFRAVPPHPLPSSREVRVRVECIVKVLLMLMAFTNIALLSAFEQTRVLRSCRIRL